MAHDEEELDYLCGGMADPLIQEVASVTGRDMRAYVLDGEVVACVMRSSDRDFREPTSASAEGPSFANRPRNASGSWRESWEGSPRPSSGWISRSGTDAST